MIIQRQCKNACEAWSTALSRLGLIIRICVVVTPPATFTLLRTDGMTFNCETDDSETVLASLICRFGETGAVLSTNSDRTGQRVKQTSRSRMSYRRIRLKLSGSSPGLVVLPTSPREAQYHLTGLPRPRMLLYEGLEVAFLLCIGTTSSTLYTGAWVIFQTHRTYHVTKARTGLFSACYEWSNGDQSNDHEIAYFAPHLVLRYSRRLGVISLVSYIGYIQ